MSATTTPSYSTWTVTARAYREIFPGSFSGMLAPFTLDLLVPVPADPAHRQYVEALAADALAALNPRGKFSYTVAPAAA